jgi:hypothetical protein
MPKNGLLFYVTEESDLDPDLSLMCKKGDIVDALK